MSGIYDLIPTVQAAALVGEGVSMAKKKKKNLLGYGIKAIAGTAFIQTESQMIGGM